jgi:thiol-disulfide isomerase/thioredoxin
MKPPSPRRRRWMKLTPKKLDFIGLFSLGLTLLWMFSVTALNSAHLLSSTASANDQMVVFTAKWCASCVTLVPSIQNVSGKLKIPVTLVDVDSTTASGTASKFGLSVPRTSLPQAYLIQGEKQTLVLNGQLYNAGDSGKVSSDLESKVNASK